MSRAIGWLPGAALVLALGCGHTHTVENTAPAPSPAAQDQQLPAGGRHRGEGTGAPVATSADALLAPGGAEKIRAKLRDQGFLEHDDDALGTGLRRFQAKHDLPETGMPDHETVAKLGLDPDQIFRKADPSK